jgi:CheY-like chemotaxis protein
MPRLLLVDDNPSIHKIAETLLAASDVQLVSCGSGDQALALVDQGDRFDVALLDTSMAGMDGWTLLRRLREAEATRCMPVAMMAGVLDVVDPEQVRQAPIQGFLKKPVELRDLAERVKRLMETPVPPPPDPDADLLALGPGDLLAEPPGPGLPSGPDAAESDVLELEELDLEGLRSLSLAAPAPDAPALRTVPAADPEEPFPMPEFLASDALSGPTAVPVTAEDLPDLGEVELDRPLAPGPALLGAQPEEIGPLDWSDESDSLVGPPPAEVPAAGAAAFPDSITFADLLETDPPARPAAVPGPAAPEPPGRSRPGPWEPQGGPWLPVPTPAPAAHSRDELAPDPLAALLANPVLLDRLARAVVARLGDQALREIAWEIMPDLAERLGRPDQP